MQSHPLDGDGINPELFKLLGRVSKTSISATTLPFRIPDTILYYGCASFWYYFDDLTNSVQKHPAKQLEKQTIFEVFSQQRKTDKSDIVALFANWRTPKLDIQYFSKEELQRFLYDRKEHFGILQKFVEPKADHAEVAHVIYSPMMTVAIRRVNSAKVYDRGVSSTMRCCGLDGPAHQCQEYFCLPHLTSTYSGLCKALVDYFCSIEPRYTIHRVACCFRQDVDETYWLMYTTSIRVGERQDPELAELWNGRRLVPHHALRQSLQSVLPGNSNSSANNTTTTANPNATANNVTGAATTSGGSSVIVPNMTGALDIAPVSLTTGNEGELEKLTSIPSKLAAIRRAQIGTPGGAGQQQHKDKKKGRPVPARLLSPFFTPGSDITAEQTADVITFVKAKQKKIKKMDEARAKLEAENAFLSRELTRLQRDASSLCHMDSIDRSNTPPRPPSPPPPPPPPPPKEQQTPPLSAVAAPAVGFAPDVFGQDVLLATINDDALHPESQANEDNGGGGGPVRSAGGARPRSVAVVVADVAANDTVGAAVISTNELSSLSGAPGSVAGPAGGGLRRRQSLRNLVDTMASMASFRTGAGRKRRVERTTKEKVTAENFVPSDQQKRAAEVIRKSITELTKRAQHEALQNAASLSDVFYPLSDILQEVRRIQQQHPQQQQQGGKPPSATGASFASRPGVSTFRAPPQVAAYAAANNIRVEECRVEFTLPTWLVGYARATLGHLWDELRVSLAEGTDINRLFPPQTTTAECTINTPFPAAASLRFAPGKLQQTADRWAALDAAAADRIAKRVVSLDHHNFKEELEERVQQFEARTALRSQHSTLMLEPATPLQDRGESPLNNNNNNSRKTSADRSTLLAQLRSFNGKDDPGTGPSPGRGSVVAALMQRRASARRTSAGAAPAQQQQQQPKKSPQAATLAAPEATSGATSKQGTPQALGLPLELTGSNTFTTLDPAAATVAMRPEVAAAASAETSNDNIRVAPHSQQLLPTVASQGALRAESANSSRSTPNSRGGRSPNRSPTNQVRPLSKAEAPSREQPAFLEAAPQKPNEEQPAWL